MAVNEAGVYMNVGDGETSYSINSGPQKVGISKTLQVLNEALRALIIDHKHSFPKCFKIADLGCSSGPNSLSVVSDIIRKVEALCEENNHNRSPEFEVFLIDLPENDFNNLFKMLPDFYQKLKNQGTMTCFVSGLPGSFYGRLVPSKSLHFIHSSFSLMWLSQVPQGLGSNKENIHVAKASPPEVYQAYKKQYHGDLSTFLSLRAEETVPGARMVLTLVGRSVNDPSIKDDCRHFALLADTLHDLTTTGKIKEADLHAFNLPIYTPSKQEVEEIVRGEGSFNLDKFEDFLVPWDVHVDRGSADVDDYKRRGELVSSFIRAFTEPVLAAHFGKSVMDEVYERYGKKMGELLSKEVPSFFDMVICLSKI